MEAVMTANRESVACDWREVTHELGRRGIAFLVRNNGVHIKCRSVNFYPSTGTVQIDGAPSFSKRGFDFFLEVLHDEGLLKE